MIKVDVHDNRNKLEAKSEYGQVEELKIEIRKHHVLPDVYILDLVMDVDGEKIMVQTQHQSGDEAFQKFSRDALKLGKTLSKDVTFLGRPKKYN
tara:strand:+ start:16 stop:297 length:282 start_codon:yes stop_codon:yes gene_type:complete